MQKIVQKAGYIFDSGKCIWIKAGYAGIAYSDGQETETRIASVVAGASDLSSLSAELHRHCSDWPSRYHLSPYRANILRPFEEMIKGDILEIGAGCGAITRYLGECGANVLALEGTVARAAIARSRTRELENVTVLAENFNDFSCEHKFDVITLIGVLEYAGVFAPEKEDPAGAMLKRVRELLKPDGKLVIAIENQLGLKYFAGAPEDHLGRPMVGIEGMYQEKRPRTFGKRVLEDMILRAGFVCSNFLAPFPDYKLPVSIVTEQGFASSKFDAAAFAWQSASRDPQLPTYRNFSLALTWPQVVENGIAMDLANSFLVIASVDNQRPARGDVLAFHYSTGRVREYCKETVFVENGAQNIRVLHRTFHGDSTVKSTEAKLFRFSVFNEEQYILGRPLSLDFVRLLGQDGWTFEQIAVWMQQYFLILREYAASNGLEIDLSSPYSRLPGEFFNFTLNNIIVDEQGKGHIFNIEWILKNGIELGHLLCRVLLGVICTLDRFGCSVDLKNITRRQFIDGVLSAMKLPISGLDYERYEHAEAIIQYEVTGLLVDQNYWKWDHPLPMLGLARVTALRESELAEMQGELSGAKYAKAELLEALTKIRLDLSKAYTTNSGQTEELARLYVSKSWRITSPLRMAMTHAGKVAKLVSRTRNALRYVFKGDVSGLRLRLQSIKADRVLDRVAMAGPPKCWGIMATPHTLFIANLIAARLRIHGWAADVMSTDPVSGFQHDMYVVICPQMFKRLPPPEKRIVYQLEQSVSSRWFTAEYIHTLEHSLAVLEYALVNIEFLKGKGIAYPYVYYLPVGAIANYMSEVMSPPLKKTCDVLFYGDVKSSPRRRKMLDILRKYFDVRVCSEIFGLDMAREIRSARVIVNLHYYENALLEMPRIQECLSLGVPVVSETAQDQSDYPECFGAVTFFEQNNEHDMVEAVRSALSRTADAGIIEEAVCRGAERFAFMFDRILVAMNYLPPAALSDGGLPLPPDAERIALSMPETIARRRTFEANRPVDCTIFDCVRFRPGWVGCGLSYMGLAKHALKHGIRRLTVLEDDTLLPEDFEAKMHIVHAYLDQKAGQWDIFVGVIATLHPDVKVLGVEVFKGICFATIDRMTSMVCNIYSERALQILSSWDFSYRDDQTNTIDKYLERQGELRVIVALPFLVGHREDLQSTLWGFQNTQYTSLIAGSERALLSKIDEIHTLGAS